MLGFMLGRVCTRKYPIAVGRFDLRIKDDRIGRGLWGRPPANALGRQQRLLCGEGLVPMATLRTRPSSGTLSPLRQGWLKVALLGARAEPALA